MRAFEQALKHGSDDAYYSIKASKFFMMVNGISIKDINDMSMEDVKLFETFVSLYKEQNNKEIAHWIAKSIIGGK